MNIRFIFLVVSVLVFGISEPGWPESLPPPDIPVARGLVQNQVSLSWVPVPGAVGYRIYRRTFEGPWVRIPEIQETTFFEDTKLQSGFEYSYEIAAVNSRGEGARSRAVTVRTKAPKVSGLKGCPGGKRERPESRHAALRRELGEECGIEDVAIGREPIARMLRGGLEVIFFRVVAFSGQPWTRESQGLGWFTLAEMKKLASSGFGQRSPEDRTVGAAR